MGSSKAGHFLGLIETAMKTYYHVTTERASRKILVNGLIPRKGSRSNKLGEREEAIYLFKSIDDAEEAVMNWLGDEFNETAILVLLEVRVPSDFSITEIEGHFEAVSANPIPAKYIRLIKKEL